MTRPEFFETISFIEPAFFTNDSLIVGAPPPLDLGGGGGGYDRPYRGSPRVTFDDS